MKRLLLVSFQVVVGMAAIGATLTVTNTGDSGSGSLRQALIDAADGDTINFELQLPAVIDLTTGPLSIDKDVEILGSGANLLTIQTDPAKEPLHVIDIPTGHTVSISGATITNGFADPGFAGGVSNSGNLTMTSCAVVNNFANWKDTQKAEIQPTGLAPTDDLESAILLTLQDAPYTAIVRGVNDTVGTAWVEVYALE